MEPNTVIETDGGAAGRRFLAIFAAAVLTLAGFVAGVNRVAWSLMTDPENQDIVQLIDGWGRVYKPILYDHVRPDVAVFGASWARDAFDPITTSRLTGRLWFNHGVSGATPYETRRFIESAMDNPRLGTVVINLDTFLRDDERVKMKYGFDEMLLDVDPDGRPTRWLAARREFAITLSGAAIGNNLEVLGAIRAREAGAEISQYLESYDRYDFRQAGELVARAREALAAVEAGATQAGDATVAPERPPGAEELERVLDTLCTRDLDVHAYFTPSLALRGRGVGNRDALLAGYGILRSRGDCRARLHYWNFNEPNPVTLDGLREPAERSDWYRHDGHPRPTIGLLMAARMLGTALPPDVSGSLRTEFGTELLSHPDAARRLQEQSAALETIAEAVRQ